MKELTFIETQYVAGATDRGFFESIAAGVVGALSGLTEFGLKWAVTGGAAGGILGAGIISGGVGFILGAIVGLVDGALYGLINGYDTTVAWFNEIVENNLNPTATIVSSS